MSSVLRSLIHAASRTTPQVMSRGRRLTCVSCLIRIVFTFLFLNGFVLFFHRFASLRYYVCCYSRAYCFAGWSGCDLLLVFPSAVA